MSYLQKEEEGLPGASRVLRSLRQGEESGWRKPLGEEVNMQKDRTVVISLKQPVTAEQDGALVDPGSRSWGGGG